MPSETSGDRGQCHPRQVVTEVKVIAKSGDRGQGHLRQVVTEVKVIAKSGDRGSERTIGEVSFWG
jgi:hypothetical protein